MEDFKLQFYFNLYKDKAMITRSLFRVEFIKRHGEFKYLEELIDKLEEYADIIEEKEEKIEDLKAYRNQYCELYDKYCR